LADDLLLVQELAALDRKLECALPDSWRCAAARLVEQARPADVLQLEFSPRARQVHAARHVAQQAQLVRRRVLPQRAPLVLLRQQEQLREAQQLAREHAERPEQLARLQVQQVLRARRVQVQRRRVHHASLLLPLLPSRLCLKWRRLLRQLRLALIV
jgi:hypothetical protein